MPTVLLSPAAASLFNTTLLTALLDYFVSTGKMTRGEVADLLTICKDEWADRAATVSAIEATKFVNGLLARFS
jgi:hypothetical protein